ncbi:MAG: hypothetical protein HC853_11280 [Anaerolineae bacterium]|nr:hypothetical protein [Anaerolineae bacterium]
MERNILCIALHENAPLILANAVDHNTVFQQLVRILIGDYGICQKQAEWAIETWQILISNLPQPARDATQPLKPPSNFAALMAPMPELTLLTPTDIYLEHMDWRTETAIVISLVNSGKAPLSGEAKILRGQSWSALSSQVIPVCLSGQQLNLGLTLNPRQMTEGHSSTLVRLITTGGISNIYVRACKKSVGLMSTVKRWLSLEKPPSVGATKASHPQLASTTLFRTQTQQFAASKTSKLVLHSDPHDA